jgi:hypothetical protein
MGLAEVMDAAKTLASSGAVQKILKFADDLEGVDVKQLNERLERIERRLGIDDGLDTIPRRLPAPDDAPATGTGGRLA